MRLAPLQRLRFALRLCGIRTCHALDRVAVRTNWPWLAFKVMSIQRRMGWNYEK